jgi:hypothetical protein
MNRGEVLWNKVFSKLENASVLQCNCGSGDDSVKVYAANGIAKEKMIAVDDLQRNLDGLKAEGFTTMKANIQKSDIVGRLRSKRFDAIVFATSDAGWSDLAVTSATNLPILLNDTGVYILVTPKAGDAKSLKNENKAIFDGLNKQFWEVRTIQPKELEETYFVFGKKKSN